MCRHVYKHVILHVGFMSQCMMHVCQWGCKASVKSKNARSASQLPHREKNRVEVGLDKNPGAMWEADTTSANKYAHMHHTQMGG